MPSKGYLTFICLVILLNYAPAETGKCRREKQLGEAEHLLQGTTCEYNKKKAASSSIKTVYAKSNPCCILQMPF